jgi:hypothetical protein
MCHKHSSALTHKMAFRALFHDVSDCLVADRPPPLPLRIIPLNPEGLECVLPTLITSYST